MVGRGPAIGLARAESGAALALIVAVLAVLWQRQPAQTLLVFDQPFYLGIAHDLVHDGRFTDGFMFARAGADGRRAPGMRFAPLYPALLAAASALDGSLRRGMDCVVDTDDRGPGCPTGAPSIRWLQGGALCGVYWLVWWMGLVVGGRAVGWLGLLLGLAVAPLLLGSVQMAMTEIASLALTTGATAAGVAAWRAEGAARLRRCGLAGVLLGLAVLTRPAFLYLLPAVPLVAVLRGGRRWLPGACVLAGGACLVLAPWLLRNWLVMGEFGLTHWYNSHTLVQRIAFDAMDWHEYGMAYVCWLPDGRSMGRALAGAGACDRFGWDAPDAFYRIGMRHLLPETLAASGGYAHHLDYLLRHYLLRMPVKHVLVSIPLALRGAYVSHWWGFVLLPVTLACTWRAWRDRATFVAAPFLILALPAWFMLAFNAAVAVNQVRYNLLLIPAYSIAGALGLLWLGRRWAARPGRRVV